MGSEQALFQLEGISKRFGGVHALEKVGIELYGGSIHALLGENGAGKSTLIKVMTGVIAPDEGTMTLNGRAVTFPSPTAAHDEGIVCVFQELSLIPDLSVADNIVAANPPTRFGLIDRKTQRRIAEGALERAGAGDIHPRTLVRDLPLSRQQMVEIAKALARKPRILILDEATSALTSADVEKVFRVLKGLREDGLGLLYISHRMNEIKELADHCTVFRNGRKIDSYKAGTRSDNEVIEMMIGREYDNVYPTKPEISPEGPPMLDVRNLSWTQKLRDISFSVRRGEIVGLGGLDGQGQRELLLALFGAMRGVEGEVRIEGEARAFTSPQQARATGNDMCLIPEDRKTEGLMLPMSVRENLSFAALDIVSRRGIIDGADEDRRIDEMVQLLAIKTESLDAPIGALSGGNQQKVVIAKWLMRHPRIILLNDPTRGIDVGTKQEIYRLLRQLADEGAAILFYSTDYDELIGCCDRVEVVYDGRISRELVGEEINEHNLIAAALDMGSQGDAQRRAVS